VERLTDHAQRLENIIDEIIPKRNSFCETADGKPSPVNTCLIDRPISFQARKVEELRKYLKPGLKVKEVSGRENRSKLPEQVLRDHSQDRWRDSTVVGE
jgi:hypothetical protein